MGAAAHGLQDLIDDLENAAEQIIPESRKVVSKGALNIKKDAQRIIRSASHRGHLPHYPRAISYDTDVQGLVVTAEIGPDKDRTQGPLGNILEYGTINNAPIPHVNPALDLEAPRFVKAMEDLAGDLLEGAHVSVTMPESG